ncbi:MAG: hypothetical protein AVO33_02410 [delta proteobacterium ML8_F1]|nr:MAG: hypothetical protein AVO33_02410 [delta proteobacterium ML8_F1]
MNLRTPLILLFCLCFASGVHAQEEDNLVRIGLRFANPEYNQGSLYGKDFYLTSGEYSLSLGANEVDYAIQKTEPVVILEGIQSREEAMEALAGVKRTHPEAYLGFGKDFSILSDRGQGTAPDGDLRVALSGDFGRVLLLSSEVVLGNQSPSFYFDGLRYRGDVRFSSYEGNLSIINQLPEEDYLYGVVPKEMSASWPLEALKAQAVIARTYLARHRNQYSHLGFDICAGSACQVYGGFTAERSATSAAVDETRGQRVYYQGELIYAYYHANSGGRTADVRNVWGGAYPYLVSVEDPFSKNTLYSNWQLTFNLEDLMGLIRDKGYQGETVEDVVTGEITGDGRVQSLTIHTDRESIHLQREEARGFFGYNTLRSTDYRVSFSDSMSLVTAGGELKGLPSGLKAITAQGDILEVDGDSRVLGAGYSRLLDPGEDTLMIWGSGWGHGVGLSQYGAREMANQGYDYRRIIAFYYQGAEVR